MTTATVRSRPSAQLLTLDAARARMLAGLAPLAAEMVPLDQALGRVLAEPLESLLTLPPWDNSAMDGFAVRSADVVGATGDHPVRLKVVGESAAGRPTTCLLYTSDAADE